MYYTVLCPSLAGEYMYVRDYWLGRARSYVLAPRPPPPPTVSSTGDTYEIRNRDNLLTEEGGEWWARSWIIRPQQSLVIYKSFSSLWCMCIRFISVLCVGVWEGGSWRLVPKYNLHASRFRFQIGNYHKWLHASRRWGGGGEIEQKTHEIIKHDTSKHRDSKCLLYKYIFYRTDESRDMTRTVLLFAGWQRRRCSRSPSTAVSPTFGPLWWPSLRYREVLEYFSE